MKLSNLILMAFILACFPLYAITTDNFQLTLNENAINTVLKQALSGTELKKPLLTLKKNSFVFEAVYPLQIIFFPADVELKFTGSIDTGSGNIYLNISKYFQNGAEQDNDVAVDRINRIIKAINNYSFEHLDNRIRAFLKKSDKYAGIIYLDLTRFHLIEHMPGLIIRKIGLENKFITVASTTTGLKNNQAEVQAYAGEDVLNGILKLYTQNRISRNFSLEKITLELFKNRMNYAFRFLDGTNTGFLRFTSAVSLPKSNLVRLDILDKEPSDAVLFSSVMSKIIRAMNSDIQQVSTAGKVKKMQFSYEENKVSFTADLKSLVNLNLQADIFSLVCETGEIAVSASID